jgi:ParB/RepB/Spo0J family partition protein
MEQAETVEVTTRVVMDEFKIVPTNSVHWKTSIRNFTREDVINMAGSLRTHSQLHSIIVKPQDQEGRFEGVIGRLRHEGAQHARLQSVLIRIHKFKSQDEILEWQLVENLHRKSMTALEKAEAYGRLARLRKKRFKEESVVQGISMSIEALTGVKTAAQTVRKYLEIDAKIGKEARNVSLRRESEKASSVRISHLEQVCRINDQNKQAELLLNTQTEQWAVTKLKTEVDRTLGVTKPKPQPVSTGLKVLCPRCLETYELIHQAKGRHSLRRVKEDPYAQALIKTRQALTTKQFNLTGFKDTMKHFGAQNIEAIEKLFWRKVQEKQIRSAGGGSFRIA